MVSKTNAPKWIAVKVERGFIVEARGYRLKASAEKQKGKWKRTMNPDYDEAEVLPIIMDEN
ncbi:MAG: hypothetical protein R6U89_05595 [Dehalococcoidia bacterium]